MNRTEIRQIINAELRINPNAQLRHFVPLHSEEAGRITSRDRFHNLVYTSPDKSYLDRENDETKAAILISQEGEHFMRKHPRILSDIERGVAGLTDTFQLGAFRQPVTGVDLGKKRKMKRLFIGGQSMVYLMEVDPEKYVVKQKTPAHEDKGHNDATQPYINEMLQIQAISVDLHEKLEAAGIEMPTYMFASGQLSCRKFVEGVHPTTEFLNEKLNILLPALNEYLDKQHDPLWRNVYTDLYFFAGRDDPIPLKIDNFILRPDGKLVWIDPFAYVKGDSE